MSKTPPFHPTHPHPPPVMCLSLLGPGSGGGGIVEKHVYVLAAYRLYGIKKKKSLHLTYLIKMFNIFQQNLHVMMSTPSLYLYFYYASDVGGGGGWSCKYNIYIFQSLRLIGNVKKKTTTKEQQKTTSNLLYYSLQLLKITPSSSLLCKIVSKKKNLIY